MATFTEMGPGASLHYLMTGDGQNVTNAAHQAHQAYSFVYGAPSQLVPNYQQQQAQAPQTQQQPQIQQQQQRPRQGGSGLPPTPPGSPRPHNGNNNSSNNNNNNLGIIPPSSIKQPPASTFASPVRTQHPSQPQSLPIYPQPSPLHPNMQNLNSADSAAIFMKQQSQQPQQIFQWQNQVAPPQAPPQQQQQTNPVPTMYDPNGASFPDPCNFCDHFAQQYHQQTQQQNAIISTTQQVVPSNLSCGGGPHSNFIGLSHHNQNIVKRDGIGGGPSLDPFRSACRSVTATGTAASNIWADSPGSTAGAPPAGSLLMTARTTIGVDDSALVYNGTNYRSNGVSVNSAGNNGGGLLQTVSPQSTASSFPAVISARDNFGILACQSTSPSLVHALSQAAQQRRQRSEKKQVPDDLKDDKYYERRKRNNVAAKKSRDSRKAREDEISIRASFLEKENAILRAQVSTLRDEATSLRQLLLQKQVTSTGPLVPRPAATSTPNAKQAFTLTPQQQQQQNQQNSHTQQNQHSLAAVVAQQAAAAAYAAAFATTSNMHHNQQLLGQSSMVDQANQQQSQQQEIIHSTA